MIICVFMNISLRYCLLLSLCLSVTGYVAAQDFVQRNIMQEQASFSASGFQVIPKYGLGMSRNFLIDLGFVGYSYIPDKNKARYLDANIGVMALIGKHTMIMPKLDLQAGLFPLDRDELICFNLGLDAGLLIDFKRSAIMLSPKAGFSVATGLMRLYYLHNFLLKDKDLFPGYGRHGVLLEINISVLQGNGFKIM